MFCESGHGKLASWEPVSQASLVRMGGMNIRNNIARIGATALIGCGLVATSVPATFAVEGAPQVVHTYADSAQFIAPDVWVEGQGLNIGGEGFKTADGTSGSVLALKLNKGAVKINGQDYLEIHADAAGNFSVTIPWQEELHGSVSVDIYLLSGSLKDGDVPRGGKAATVTIKVAEQPAPVPSEEPTPAPSENPTPAPTAEPTTEPSAEASESASSNPSAPAVEDAKETKPAEDQKPAEEQKSDQASDSSAKDEKTYKYQNCADVWADRGTSIFKGDPDFREKFDADGDDEGCEEQPNYENSTSDHVGMSSNSNDDLGSGSSNASSKGSSSLAKTGASDAMTAAGLGLIALGAGGATIVATRMRKKA